MNVIKERKTDATPMHVSAYREATLRSLQSAREAWRSGEGPPPHPLELWFSYHRTVIDDFTQDKMAKTLGITPAFMSQLVHGYRRHGPGAGRKFAEACNAAVAEHPLAIEMQLGDVRPDIWH
ncbi:MAG: hypothetical protein EOM22_12880 [Gammaproteobacteria bacterium]|nr:hypothetical protein [Gammaproteobacteria bacterium]